ncbi:hypothetical protein EVJ27_10560 [Exiguobacterium sp. SH3S2]|uniref:hypothetical protein n=1 Tax=unclassified Exiguobacterium TaxID=2644629 RepID=UPI00103EF2A8|nr:MULTISPECIES: hypothetical protein [unclassified Exiguobacterium]TCI43400.1 hypothetical protein EVJ28_10580 [Exiguobacterium sp. SH3S3]TCI59246.1 hypothetical protein EVJ27_10560 [Exiguobacterium sp. SH3S2]
MRPEEIWDQLTKLSADDIVFSFEDVNRMIEFNPTEQVLYLQSLFLPMSYEWMRDLSGFNNYASMPKSYFEAHSIQYGWKALKTKYNLSMKNYREGIRFLEICENVTKRDITKKEANEALTILLQLGQSWILDFGRTAEQESEETIAITELKSSIIPFDKIETDEPNKFKAEDATYEKEVIADSKSQIETIEDEKEQTTRMTQELITKTDRVINTPLKEQINPFVDFMHQYDLTTADYSKIFDEHTKKIEYSIDTNINQKIIDELSTSPRSIIITGNAGDGKTRICRNVYDQLVDKEFEGWPESGIEEITYKDYTIRVIKDLSELRDEIIVSELQKMQETLEVKDSNVYFLIAANEGKLTHTLVKYPELKALKDAIIPQFLSPNKEFKEAEQVKVYNLLYASSSVYAEKIIEGWNEEENWDICGTCSSRHKCIINNNHVAMSNKTTRNRMMRMYKSLDMNGKHMTMRELLIHLAYTQTGGMTCRNIHEASQSEAIEGLAKKSYYENFFGNNLRPEVFEEISGIQEFKSLDPGYISDSLIDDFLLNGDLSSQEKTRDAHTTLFKQGIDVENGAYYEEVKMYRSNINGDNVNGVELMSKWFPRLRRKYYFESKDNKKVEQLIPYRHRHEFIGILHKGKIEHSTKIKLIDGLNTFFAKRMVFSPSHQLYVASDSLLVHQIIGLDQIDFVVQEKNEEIDQASTTLILNIQDIELEVNLVTFEYLMRLSNGGMLNVLREHVEILLNSFRNRLIPLKKQDEDILQILKFDYSQGAFVLETIEIKTPDLENDEVDEDEDEDF